MRSSYEEKIGDVLRLHHEGKSLQEIAQAVGLADITVRNYLKKNNIIINTRRKIYESYKDQITSLYNEGKTIREISKIIGRHETQVGKWIKEAGINIDHGRGVRKYESKYVTKQCEICSQDYDVESWRQESSRFCSHRCFGVHHSDNLKGVSRTSYPRSTSQTRGETLKRIWTDEKRKEVSNRMKNLWKDKNSNIHNRITPNRKKSRIERLLSGYIGKIGYETNNSIWIEGLDSNNNIKKRLPDFIDFKGKRVLEYFGSYWHRDDNEQEIIQWYRDLGWECRIVWENKIEDFLSELGI